jgi:hypothetical protein
MEIRTIFLIAAAQTAFLHSCKKQDNTAYINPELKKHFNFKEGSYWIYRDSLTGSMDTFTVYNNITTITERDPYRSETLIEIQRIELRCSKDPDILSGYFSLMNNSATYIFPHFKYGTGVNYEYFSDPTRLMIHSSNGISFDSVVQITPDSSTFYIKKDIGFVKLRLMKDTIRKVWELQQWKIVQ